LRKSGQEFTIYNPKFFVTIDAVLLEIGNALTKNFKTAAIEIIKILRNSNKTEVIEIG